MRISKAQHRQTKTTGTRTLTTEAEEQDVRHPKVVANKCRVASVGRKAAIDKKSEPGHTMKRKVVITDENERSHF